MDTRRANQVISSAKTIRDIVRQGQILSVSHLMGIPLQSLPRYAGSLCVTINI